MADRVYVMYDGRITGCIDYEDVSQESIMKLATLEADQTHSGAAGDLNRQEAKNHA